ncbi:MAG: hypothetical protein WAN11_27270 [Syntrophobacteraceae bacterium]
MKRKIHLVLAGLASLCSVAFVGGCNNVILFHPKGPIGDAERFVIIAALALMLIVVIPVFIMTFWFSRKYRASNFKAAYHPKWRYFSKIDLVLWLVPLVIVIALGIIGCTYTYQLDPYKPIKSDVKPVSIEVVALDWKWLFIYPDHNIATINQLIFPANVLSPL